LFLFLVDENKNTKHLYIMTTPHEPQINPDTTTTIPPSPPTPQDANQSYNNAMESLLRISLAGFGGALAGLSLSRTRRAPTSLPSLTGLTKTRSKPFIDADLPTTWAVSCVAFAGIVEFCRVVSPSHFLSTTFPLPENIQVPEFVKKNEKALTTLSDYTIGGSIAGAIFQGASVRTKTSAKLIKAGLSLGGTTARTGIMAGLIPGASLGCFAGIVMVGLDALEELAVKTLGSEEEEEGETVVVEKQVVRRNDGIPQDIKEMSNEEIQQQIDAYLSNKNKTTVQDSKENSEDVAVLNKTLEEEAKGGEEDGSQEESSHVKKSRISRWISWVGSWVVRRPKGGDN